MKERVRTVPPHRLDGQEHRRPRNGTSKIIKAALVAAFSFAPFGGQRLNIARFGRGRRLFSVGALVAALMAVGMSPVQAADVPESPSFSIGTVLKQGQWYIASSAITGVRKGYPLPTITVLDGVLPGGMSLSATGVLTGQATASAGEYPVTVRASSTSGIADVPLVFVVASPPTISGTPWVAHTGEAYEPFSMTLGGYPLPTVKSGGLPAGMQLSAGGVFSGTPDTMATGIYELELTATNSAGIEKFPVTLVVTPRPRFTGSNPPAGWVGLPYNMQLGNAVPDAVFTVEGGALPPGVTLSESGKLSGTPEKSGSFGFRLHATTKWTYASRLFSIAVNEGPGVSGSLPQGLVGAAYSGQLTPTGYPDVAKTSLHAVSAPLPAGLTLSESGLVSGTPVVGSGGNYSIRVAAVTPAASSSKTLAFTIREAASISGHLPDASAQESYQPTKLVRAGFPSPSLSIVSGALPAGMKLESDGTVSGTPEAGSGGRYSLVVQAKNAVSTASLPLEFSVTERPSLSGALHGATVGIDFDPVQLGGRGFPAPIAALKSGALPAGMTLSETGEVAGVPATGSGGDYEVVVTYTNEVGTAELPLRFSVDESPRAELPAGGTTGRVGATFGPLGLRTSGYPVPTIATTSGKLPEGLSLTASGAVVGTPATGTGGVYSLILTVSNRVAAVDVPLVLTIEQKPSVSGSIHNAEAGTEYQPAALKIAGFPTPEVRVKSGQLPDGMKLSTAGELTGTPIAGSAGKYSFVVEAVNSLGAEDLALSLWVVNPAVQLTHAAVIGTADKVTATGSDFTPGGSVEIWLHSTPRLVGTMTADQAGAVAMAVGDIPAGRHHFELVDVQTGRVAVSDYFAVEKPVIAEKPAAADTRTQGAAELAATGATQVLIGGFAALVLLLTGICLMLFRLRRTAVAGRSNR